MPLFCAAIALASAPAFTPSVARVVLDRSRVAPGGIAWATFMFRSTGPAQSRLRVFVHVTPQGQGQQFGADFDPEIPTTRWPSSGFAAEGPHPIAVPTDAAPGKYRIFIGMFDPVSGERVPMGNTDRDDGTHRYAVAELDVDAAAPAAQPAATFNLLPIDDSTVVRAGDRHRTAPRSPIVLRNRTMTVHIDPADGMPYEYCLAQGGRMLGEPTGDGPLLALTQDASHTPLAVEPVAGHAHFTATSAEIPLIGNVAGKPAVHLTLRYTLSSTSLSVTAKDIREEPGFELTEVRLPALASVSSADPKAWLATAESGGQRIELATARPGQLRTAWDWGYAAPVAMVGDAAATAAVEAPAYLDALSISVVASSSQKVKASLGAVIVRKVAGGPHTPNLTVDAGAPCHVTVLPGNPETGWLDAANVLRKGMPARRTGFYDDRFIYKIFCDMPGAHDCVTFDQALQLVRGIAALTDRAPQVAYVVGWQHHGHDTGYPDVSVVNARLGNLGRMQNLVAEAKKVNCILSAHDNYDDAYRDSPAWDERIIARDVNGNLMKGGVWAGGQSYIIGMHAYLAHGLAERVANTCSRYPFHQTYHIDVLSAAPLRNDWNPDDPASAVANLHAKWAVLNEFAKHGLDVTSEGMSWPFIGHISYFWNLPHPRGDRFGHAEPIPLVPALLRLSSSWGGISGTDNAAITESLFYNSAFSRDLGRDDAALGAAAYYLLQVPWIHLHQRLLRSFRSEAGRTLLDYGNGTRVELDADGTHYRVTVGGVEIARDGATFCRLDDRRIAFYAREDRELSAPLPSGWQAGSVTAVALSQDGARKPVTATIHNRRITVTVPAGVPIMLYRTAEDARRGGPAPSTVSTPQVTRHPKAHRSR